MTLLLLAACRYDGPGGPDPVDPAPGPAPDTTTSGTVDLCAWGRDEDGDGYTTPQTGGTDCNDLDTDTHPGADDAFVDGLDADCDGVDGPPEACAPAPETCDGTDEDCDGRVDDPWSLVVDVEAGVALVADFGEGPRVVAGIPGGITDGEVRLYDTAGVQVARLDGTGLSASFGQQIAAGRDLTGDGVADLVVAAPWADDGVGRVLVYAGLVADGAQPVWTFLGGELPGRPGEQLALLPDVTGDGRAELLISHYRHMLLFSGVEPGATAGAGDAVATWEISTGGGAWEVGTLPDVDGDLLPEVVFGLSTYQSGAGMIVRWDSRDLVGNPTYVVGTEGEGLGGALAVVGDRLYTVDAGVLAEVGSDLALTSLGVAATAVLDAGDLDGDGVSDVVVATDRGLEAPELGQVAAPLTPQDRRDLGPAQDVDGDGVPELPVILDDGAVAILDGTMFGRACDGDGDGVTVTDCDDDDPTAYPGAREEADGADDDCDGRVDAPSEEALGWAPRWAGGIGDADGDGSAEWAALSSDGVVTLYDGEAGLGERATVTGGLAAARDFAGVGDTDGNGFVELLWAGTDTTVLAPAGEGGDLFARAATTFIDGTRWHRDGAVGHAGDVDGDGRSDVWMTLRDDDGGTALAIWTAPPAGTIVVEDADSLLQTPPGWDVMNVGTATPGRGGDLDGDGRDDLVAANPYAYYGYGRALVLTERPVGEGALDVASVLSLFGEPDEGLGAAVALGGDLDGDGHADAIVAGADGARVLFGGACPLPARVAPGFRPASVALVDLDGDGRATAYLGDTTDDGTIWAADAAGAVEAWRTGTPDRRVGTQLYALGDTDGSLGDDLLYVTTGDAVRAGGLFQ